MSVGTGKYRYGYSLVYANEPTKAIESPDSPKVPWVADYEYALEAAIRSSNPFALFFVTGDAAHVVGEGKVVRDAWRKKYGSIPTATIFEDQAVMDAFSAAGVNIFAKVNPAQDGSALFRKYVVSLGSLVICAPDGAALQRFRGSEVNAASVTAFLKKSFAPAMAKWDAQAKATEAKKAQAAQSKLPAPGPEKAATDAISEE